MVRLMETEHSMTTGPERAEPPTKTSVSPECIALPHSWAGSDRCCSIPENPSDISSSHMRQGNLVQVAGFRMSSRGREGPVVTARRLSPNIFAIDNMAVAPVKGDTGLTTSLHNFLLSLTFAQQVTLLRSWLCL